MKRPYSVLPIGTVNLITGKNALFGKVWHGWDENANRLNILLLDKETFRYKAIHATNEAGKADHPIGSVMELKHDQTFQRIGGWDGWTVVGFFPHTPAGMLEMKKACGKAGVSFATFK